MATNKPKETDTAKRLIGTMIPGTTLRIMRTLTEASKTGKQMRKVMCKCVVCENFSNSSREEQYDYSQTKSKESICIVCKQRIRDAAGRENDEKRKSNYNKELEVLYYHELEIITREGVLYPGLKPNRKYLNSRPNAQELFRGIPEVLKIGNLIESKTKEGKPIKYKVVGYTGIYGDARRQNQPDKVALKCHICYCTYADDIDNFKDASYNPKPCADCRDSRRQTLNLPYKNGFIAETGNTANAKELTETEKAQKEVKNKAQEQADKFAELLQSKNPKCFVHGLVQDNMLVGKAICKLCGYSRGEHPYTKGRTDWDLGECKGCKAKIQDPFFRGKYKMDYVGKVFNGMEITKQYEAAEGFLCDVRCISKSKTGMCGKNRFGLPLHEVINRKYFCENCKNLSVLVMCGGKVKIHGEWFPCEEPLHVTIANLEKGDFQCKKCRNFKVTREVFDKKAAFQDVELTFELADSKLKKELGTGQTKFDVENNLIISKEDLYKGVADAQGYKRVACIKDNGHLTLSNDEIEEFDCNDHCSNIQQKMLPDIFSKQVQSQLKL